MNQRITSTLRVRMLNVWIYGLITLLQLFICCSHTAVKNHGTRSLNDIQFHDTRVMDALSRKAMKRFHDDLDRDDDGGISISEGVKFFAGHKELTKGTGENVNLAGFVNDTDGRITEQEFWDSWINSSVHNWTNEELISWLKNDVELPQYTNKFKAYNVGGAAFPFLAYNSTVVAALVEGSKENKLKLMLKFKEVVLFGPPKQNSSWLKDALLTFSLAIAICAIVLSVHIQRSAKHTIVSMQQKMNALQSTLQSMEEENVEDDVWPKEAMRQDDEKSATSVGTESDDSSPSSYSLNGDEKEVKNKLAEVMRDLDSTKEALRNAEKQLQRKSRSWQVPNELIKLLQATYSAEAELFEQKRQQVQKNVDQTKSQFLKIERNRTTFLGILHVIHSRQVDSFDYQVQKTRDEIKEIQNMRKKYRERWMQIEKACNCRIVPSRSRVAKLSSQDDLSSLLSADISSSTVDLNGIGIDQTSLQKAKPDKLFKPASNSDYRKMKSEDQDNLSLKSFSSQGRKKQKSSATTQHRASDSFTYANYKPTLSLDFNGRNVESRTAKVKPIRSSQSESTMSVYKDAGLLSAVQDTYQTFPKRSPITKRRGKLSDLMESPGGLSMDVASDQQSVKSLPLLPTPEKNKKSPRENTASPLDSTKRSSSSQSLPQMQNDLGKLSPEKKSFKVPGLVENSSGSRQVNEVHLQNDQNLPPARKSNLKIRSYFTFMKKKK